MGLGGSVSPHSPERFRVPHSFRVTAYLTRPGVPTGRRRELRCPSDMETASTKDASLGICLSGGGFRAALYGLGALRYLAESGSLARVRVVCGVSGGSVAAAALVAAGEVSDRFVEAVFDPFIATVTTENLRNRALGRWARRRLGPHGRPRNLVLSDVLGEALYPHAGALADLPAHPQLVITATDLGAGRAFRFSQAFVGSYDWGYAATPRSLRLSTAVAASVAAPPAFPPLQLPTAGLGLDRDPPPGLSITDGGVYDNLGIEWFQGWSSARRPEGAASADFLVIVNASGPLRRERRTFIGLRAMNRSRRIQYAQTQATRVRWLVSDLEAGRQHGTYLGITGDPRRYRLPNGDPVDPAYSDAALPSRLVGPLAQLRTDLNRFSANEAALLAYHGYWSTHARFASLYPELSVPQPGWRAYAGMSEADALRLERELQGPRHRIGLLR